MHVPLSQKIMNGRDFTPWIFRMFSSRDVRRGRSFSRSEWHDDIKDSHTIFQLVIPNNGISIEEPHRVPMPDLIFGFGKGL